MPVERITGLPEAAIASSIGTLVISPEATFQPATPTRASSAKASIENGELRNDSPASAAWRASPAHCASVNSIRRQ